VEKLVVTEVPALQILEQVLRLKWELKEGLIKVLIQKKEPVAEVQQVLM
jgi:hypothetical protein